MLKYVACLCLFPYAATARIGETLQQCESRYGPSTALKIEAETAVYSFTKGPYSIAATVWKGTVHSLLISKRSGHAVGISQELTEAEWETFFEANRGQSLWIKKLTDSKNYGFWELSDQSRKAVYELRTHILLFTTREYSAKSASDKAALDKATLRGF
ncbi:hypothetical protein OVA24_05830 [Luteolibacter sp. SL250]|uniref:hypothetical protein n=1 Tax=Luteolibacter sp. SL250 TaxID=2995170 RepID=UPI00226EAEF9|nr:hypothetical protein [Luteolibacter sp. SL250]WAC20900.1 hypothetical protein OVA24_05830 [Luteolibacter sp. SL250]